METSAQNRLPIIEAIHDYIGIGRIHMPGHKGGTGVAEPFLKLVGEKAFQADVVGVEGLDDFHSPGGCIAEAQKLAAEAWGADHTFFLVNGTSCGLHALVLSLCGPGDKLIIPRNVHRSVVGGLILSGAEPVYMEPEIDEEFGMPLSVTPETVKKAILKSPEAKGVLIVSPTYYGVISDIQTIAEITHAHGIPLLIDEAHGAHLGFNPDLPASSLQLGADAVVQGVHKTAGSLSQGSMLHLKGSRVPRDVLTSYLRLLQTTSPSYLLTASLDAARYMLATEGNCRLRDVLNFSQIIGDEINGMEKKGMGVRLLHLDFSKKPFCTDPTRIVINLRGTSFTGYKMENLLRYKYGVQIELADFSNIILLLSIGDKAETIKAFIAAFKKIIAANDFTGTAQKDQPNILIPPTPPIVLNPAGAFRLPKRPVSLENSADLVCAEMIAAYPPGVPVIYPGEKITPVIIDYLSQAKRAGVHLQGSLDPTLQFINVVDL